MPCGGACGGSSKDCGYKDKDCKLRVIFIIAVFDESNLFFLSIFSMVLELYNIAKTKGKAKFSFAV